MKNKKIFKYPSKIPIVGSVAAVARLAKKRKICKIKINTRNTW